MRIVSVVTLASPDGEFGGPLRVALNQARALRGLGHEVLVVAGARGYDALPTEIDGVPVRLFPARSVVPRSGFAGTAAPGMLRWLRRHRGEVDLVHVHCARDLVTLPVAWLARRLGLPLVLQTHGMIDPSDHRLARPLDALLTRRLLRSAGAVLSLNPTESNDLREVAGAGLEVTEVHNGVPLQPDVASPERSTVLFLARLAPRKRPVTFVEACVQVARRHPGTRFVLVGPDEGEGPAVRAGVEAAAAQGVDISWRGAVPPEQTVQHMLAASVYVLPALDEPYGMTVVEALSVGVPVVVTDSCGLAPVVRRVGCGLVVDEQVSSLAAAIEELLGDPAEARRRGAEGRAYVRDHLTMEAVARELERCYRGLVGAAPAR